LAQVLSIDTIEFRRANDAKARHAFIVAQGTEFFYPVLDYRGATDTEITIEAVVQHCRLTERYEVLERLHHKAARGKFIRIDGGIVPNAELRRALALHGIDTATEATPPRCPK
jgi:hypothetical protein